MKIDWRRQNRSREKIWISGVFQNIDNKHASREDSKETVAKRFSVRFFLVTYNFYKNLELGYYIFTYGSRAKLVSTLSLLSRVLWVSRKHLCFSRLPSLHSLPCIFF